MPAKRRREKSAAVVSILAAPKMTAKGRRQVASWLRRHADMLVKDGKNYTTGRFVARYLWA